MGLFDAVRAEVRCPECGEAGEREVQFKHPLAWQETYEIGELVPSAPVGQAAIEARFSHEPDDEENRHRVECWIHLHDGFVTDVTLDRPEVPTERDPEMVDRLGRAALARKRGLRQVRSLVSRRRRSRAVEAEDTDGTAEDEEAGGGGIETFLRSDITEDELFDQLEQAVESSLEEWSEPGPFVLW